MDTRLTLEKRIEAEIASYDGKLSVYANDLKGHIIDRHCDELFETASCIKTFILACLFMKIEEGKASLEDQLIYKKEDYVKGSGVFRSLEIGASMKVKDVAVLMIIVSDNIATNMMIDYLGIEEINKAIQKLGCVNTKLHNKIDFEKYHQLGTTTPREYGSMFERLAKGTLISPEADKQMIEIFKQQHYNSMITKDFPPYFLDSEDTGDEELITIASKSGSMDACRNDGGIVFTPYGPYIIVLMNKEFSDPIYYPDHPATVFGAKVSRLLFDQYLALEGKFV